MKKKPLLFLLTLLGAGSFLFSGLKTYCNTSNVSIVLAADDEQQLIEAREDAFGRIAEMVDVNDYDGQAREELEAELAKVTKIINDADTVYRIFTAVGDFNQYLDQYFFERYPTLEQYRSKYKFEIESYSWFYSYDPSAQPLLDQKIQEAWDKIDATEDFAKIEEIFEEFVDYFENDFLPHNRIVEEIRKEALDYIDWTFTQLDRFPDNEQENILYIGGLVRPKIEHYETSYEIYHEYKEYIYFFETTPTIAQLELEEAVNYYSYRIGIAVDISEVSFWDYRIDAIHECAEWAHNDIEAATSADEVREYYDDFIFMISDYYEGEDIEALIDEIIAINSMTTKTGNDKSNNTGLIVACAVEGGVIVLGTALALFFFLRKKKQ